MGCIPNDGESNGKANGKCATAGLRVGERDGGGRPGEAGKILWEQPQEDVDCKGMPLNPKPHIALYIFPYITPFKRYNPIYNAKPYFRLWGLVLLICTRTLQPSSDYYRLVILGSTGV